jgi:hypothetical protein
MDDLKEFFDEFISVPGVVTFSIEAVDWGDKPVDEAFYGHAGRKGNVGGSVAKKAAGAGVGAGAGDDAEPGQIIAYHGTRASNLDSILAKGIVPQNYSNWNWNLDNKPEAEVFASTDLSEAVEFGKVAASMNSVGAGLNPNLTWAVVEVRIPKSVNIEKDDRVESGKAFKVKEIDPKWIKKIHFYGLKPTDKGWYDPKRTRTVAVNETTTASYTRVYVPLPKDHVLLKKNNVKEAFYGHAGRKGKVGGSVAKKAAGVKITGASEGETARIKMILSKHDPKVVRNLGEIEVADGPTFNALWKKVGSGESYKDVAAWYSETTGRITINRTSMGYFGWNNTLNHEIGHSAYYHSKGAAKLWASKHNSDPKFDRFTAYAKEDIGEAFAESYMAYASAGGKAKSDRHKRVFDTIREVIKNVGSKNYYKGVAK